MVMANVGPFINSEKRKKDFISTLLFVALLAVNRVSGLVLNSCPTNFTLFSGKCYKLITERETYSAARTKCSSWSDYSMLTMQTEAEYYFIKDRLLVNGGQNGSIWLGVTPDWKWVTGSEFRWTPEGSSINETMSCGIMTPGGAWDSTNDCTGPHSFVCEGVYIACPEGYTYYEEEELCLGYHSKGTDYRTALEFCSKRPGYSLAGIRRVEDGDFINALISSTPDHSFPFWMGVERHVCSPSKDCDYEWWWLNQEGGKVKEPPPGSSIDESHLCAYVREDKTWQSTTSCNAANFGFVCEGPTVAPCPDDWPVVGDSCLSPQGVPCKEVFPQSDTATVRSQEEQDQVLDIFRNSTWPLRIGCLGDEFMEPCDWLDLPFLPPQRSLQNDDWCPIMQRDGQWTSASGCAVIFPQLCRGHVHLESMNETYDSITIPTTIIPHITTEGMTSSSAPDSTTGSDTTLQQTAEQTHRTMKDMTSSGTSTDRTSVTSEQMPEITQETEQMHQTQMHQTQMHQTQTQQTQMHQTSDDAVMLKLREIHQKRCYTCNKNMYRP